LASVPQAWSDAPWCGDFGSFVCALAIGGEAGARDAGKLRLEGKDYVVADGDVTHFRFAN